MDVKNNVALFGKPLIAEAGLWWFYRWNKWRCRLCTGVPSPSASLVETLGVFPRPGWEWRKKTAAFSASPGHPKSSPVLRSTLSFLWSKGLHAFISSFLPSSKGHWELVSSVVGLSGFHLQQSEGQTTPCPLWRSPVVCSDCVQTMTCSWSGFSGWTLDCSAGHDSQRLPGLKPLSYLERYISIISTFKFKYFLILNL